MQDVLTEALPVRAARAGRGAGVPARAADPRAARAPRDRHRRRGHLGDDGLARDRGPGRFRAGRPRARTSRSAMASTPAWDASSAWKQMTGVLLALTAADLAWAYGIKLDGPYPHRLEVDLVSRSISATSPQALRSALRGSCVACCTHSPRTRHSAISRAASQGDHRAWDALVARYGGMVWAVARAHRLCDADAADASQATWLKLLEHIGDIKEPRALGGWLATTARRECLRILRRASRVDPLDAGPGDRGRRPGAGRAAAHRRARRPPVARRSRGSDRATRRSCGCSRPTRLPATRRSAPRSACRSARSGQRGHARSSGSAARSTRLGVPAVEALR